MFIFSYIITCLKYFNKHCSKEDFETEGGEDLSEAWVSPVLLVEKLK
jgi:hypothetical protein